MADEHSTLTGWQPIVKNLPTNGEGWYIEAARPGHEDEARVYDAQHYGVCKPTPNNTAYRRPIAEFIVNAAQLVALTQELRDALQEMTEDLEARWDMSDRRTNPGIRHCVEQARSVLAKVDTFDCHPTVKESERLENANKSAE